MAAFQSFHVLWFNGWVSCLLLDWVNYVVPHLHPAGLRMPGPGRGRLSPQTHTSRCQMGPRLQRKGCVTTQQATGFSPNPRLMMDYIGEAAGNGWGAETGTPHPRAAQQHQAAKHGDTVGMKPPVATGPYSAHPRPTLQERCPWRCLSQSHLCRCWPACPSLGAERTESDD